MGSVVGERFVRGVRVAYESRIPFVCISGSGGARMQEGVNSLFQMAKTTAVLQELSKARLPFVSVLTDPTMGGVSASFAFVADLVLAEPGALIGFAGPRVRSAAASNSASHSTGRLSLPTATSAPTRLRTMWCRKAFALKSNRTKLPWRATSYRGRSNRRPAARLCP